MKKLKILLLENLYPRQIVLRNAFWLYLSEFLSKGLRVIVFLLIVRLLGPRGLGIFEYFLSFVGLFFLFADFGISPIFIRDYQQKENKEDLINSAFLLKIFLSFVFGFLAFLGYFFSKKIDGLLLYSIFVLFYIVQNIENFFENYFIAVQKTEKKFIFNTLASLFLLILIIFFSIFISRNVLIIAIAYLLGMSASLFLAYFLFKKETKISLRFNLQFIKYYLFNGLPLALFGVLGYIFFSTDKVIISYLRPIEETGYYSAASRIVGAFFLIPSIFNTALFPLLAKKVKDNDRSLENLLKIFVIGSTLIGFLFSLLIFLLAPYSIFIFGEKFANSIPILQLLSLILIFVFPTTFLDHFLISYNRQWLDFNLTIIPAILNLVLNFILIPSYGVFGAVYSSLIAQLLNFILTFTATLYVLKMSKNKANL